MDNASITHSSSLVICSDTPANEDARLKIMETHADEDFLVDKNNRMD